jgi:hypothetical protein
MGALSLLTLSLFLIYPVGIRDMYSIITQSTLLPIDWVESADYTGLGTRELDREATVDDICDFVVEYINSDVLVSLISLTLRSIVILTFYRAKGLLSDRHLVIAGMSVKRFCPFMKDSFTLQISLRFVVLADRL